MWLYFCHIRWFPYFFFPTFYGTSLTKRSTNITCDCTFVTFDNSLIYFSHLMIPFSYYGVPTSYVTAFLSHFMVPLFLFSHLNGTIFTLGSTHFLILWLSSPFSQFFYSLLFSLQFRLSQILLLQTIHKNLSRATITK